MNWGCFKVVKAVMSCTEDFIGIKKRPVTRLRQTNDNFFECGECRKEFAKLSELDRHVKTHIYNISSYSKECNSLVMVLDDNASAVFLKDEGGKLYESSAQHEYQRIKDKEKLFSCVLCKFSCSRANSLERHVRIHTGSKPYECEKCSYECRQSSALQKHLRTHTGEKPFHCHLCSYKCAYSSYLQNHLKTYSGEKPYGCSLCKKSFATHGQLQNHLRVHTGEKPYQCEVCTFSCAQSGSLQRHMWVHTGDKPYQCQHCSYRCTQSSSLQKHKKTHEISKKQVKNKNENADEENIYIIVPNDI